MTRSFCIDALPERALAYPAPFAVVAVDAFRATTTIVTALAAGRRVYPVASLPDAERLSQSLLHPLLVGELAGNRPDGFDMNNSPAELEQSSDRRPVVLLSSSGTLLLTNARSAAAIYVACFRNLRVTAHYVAGRHDQVAIIGAGSRGAARPEDEMACAWIADHLLKRGFEAVDERSSEEVIRWRGADIQMIRQSPSADYLRATGQAADIDFVAAHVDDLDLVAAFDGTQVNALAAASSPIEEPA
jgi:2-phosphosulfolactate phosphatase